MKHKLLIIVISVLAALCIGAGLYSTMFTPSARAERLAKQIMQDVQAGDAAATFDRHGKPSDAESFISAASQRNYRYLSLVQDESFFYVRFEFTDSKSPLYARLAIKDNRLSGVSIGDKLGATPANDETALATNSSTNSCLVSDDLTLLDATRLYGRTIRGATMIFADDTSVEYVNDERGEALLTRMKTFYESANEKDFSFLLRGYLATSDEANQERLSVVNNRTTKMQQDLVDRGIPRDRIRIGTPISYDSDQASEVRNTRYALIDVVNHCVD